MSKFITAKKAKQLVDKDIVENIYTFITAKIRDAVKNGKHSTTIRKIMPSKVVRKKIEKMLKSNGFKVSSANFISDGNNDNVVYLYVRWKLINKNSDKSVNKLYKTIDNNIRKAVKDGKHSITIRNAIYSKTIKNKIEKMLKTNGFKFKTSSSHDDETNKEQFIIDVSW